ncbi:MAG: hypothetical protein GQ574_23000 [Crocinitomix sp.]|nr:hypothetical protein [Crocinitomix sp.]
MQNSPFPFSRFHQVGVAPIICNRALIKPVPFLQRNFYLDTPPAVLQVVFQNSSRQQLNAHFAAIKALVLNYPFNQNKRRSLFRLLRYLHSLGGG